MSQFPNLNDDITRRLARIVGLIITTTILTLIIINQ